jgi:broad specificity phosphatase PhoE
MTDRTPTRFFIRHAEPLQNAGDDPELSAAGTARAEALAEMLRHFAIGAIIVSSKLRTQRTAKPLAQDLEITPEIVLDDPLHLEPHVAAVLAKLNALPEATNALIIGHTTTVPAIICRLGGPQLATILENEFDNLFVMAGGCLVHLHYHP